MLKEETIKKTRGRPKVPGAKGSNVKRIPSKTDFEIYNELSDKRGLSYREYCKYMFAFNLYVMNYLIYTGHTFNLPFFLGSLVVIRRKPRGCKRIVDFGFLKKTGIKKFHKNMHSEGYYARFAWVKKRRRYKNLLMGIFITFRTNRSIKKDLNYAIVHKNTIYKYKESRY